VADQIARQMVAAEAIERYVEVEAYYLDLAAQYNKRHFYYSPPRGDQWPEDAKKRPGKIHMTENVIKPAVEIRARLEAILPRLALVPPTTDPATRKQAEGVEKMVYRFLELANWEVQLAMTSKTKNLYGKTFFKVFWNNDEKRPDFTAIEQPQNLRVGWGDSNYETVDWIIYEYAISPIQAMRRFPDVQVSPNQGKDKPLKIEVLEGAGDHADPIDSIDSGTAGTIGGGTVEQRPFRPQRKRYTLTDYERKQVRVWDYWYIDEDGVVQNVIMLNRTVVAEGTHSELIGIPYIPVPNDREPGNPEGMSIVDDLVDLQIEFNRLMSHWMQAIADNIDPAYQLRGEGNDEVPAGSIPAAGDAVAPGGNRFFEVINKGVGNIYQMSEAVAALWNEIHRRTGLSEVLWGQLPGAQTSGRAVAIQIEGASNRIGIARLYMYNALIQVLVMWLAMIERMDVKIKTPDGETLALADKVKGMRRWKVIAPEITPRDVIEATMNEINKINAKLSSNRSSMDRLGEDSPEDELELIREERSDVKLYPGEVQSQMAVAATAQQIAMAGGAAPTPEASSEAADQDAQTAQPTLDESQNEESLTPATGVGSAPPAGAGAEGLGFTQQTLLRGTPSGQVQPLQQLTVREEV
jgi:hypothetical protein